MARTKQTTRAGMKRRHSEVSSNSVVNFGVSTTYHDRVIVVGRKKFYVNSGVLCQWSKYFRTQFNVKREEEDTKPELEVKDVHSAVFESFLNILYNANREAYIGHQLAELIELSFRFEAPKILDGCKEIMLEDKKTMYSVELLEAACKHSLHDIKDLVIDYFKETAEEQGFYPTSLLKCAIDYNLDKLKECLVPYFVKRAMGSPEYCIGMLNFALENNLSSLKVGIIKELAVWNINANRDTKHYYGSAVNNHPPVISDELILPMLECAFKHDIDELRTLLRHRIFYFAKTTDFHINEVRDEVKSDHRITVNAFIEKNREQILALPKEIMDFVLMSIISPDECFVFVIEIVQLKN